MESIQESIEEFNQSKDFKMIKKINNDIDNLINIYNDKIDSLNDIVPKSYKKYKDNSIEELFKKMEKTNDIDKKIKIYQQILFMME
jgi:mevalonate kinase